MDISDFFVRSRLSKLRLLDLSGNLDISWNHLVPRTTHLTTLSLQIGEVPSTATLSTSQLFSILVSNPNLRQLKLSDGALPDDNQGVTFQVPLHYLKRLLSSGDLFGFLRRLILPEMLERMCLTGVDPTVEGVSQILGPYMRDYFRRGSKFQVRLKTSLSLFRYFFAISVDAVCAQTTTLAQDSPPLAFKMVLIDPPPDALGQLFVDLIAHIPKEVIPLALMSARNYQKNYSP